MFSLAARPKSPSKPAHLLPYGVVTEPIAPFAPGRIKYEGIFWKALIGDACTEKLGEGDLVEVIGRQGISLLVVPFRPQAKS